MRAFSIIQDWDADLCSDNPLGFPGYHPPVPAEESVRTGLTEIDGVPAAVIECRFDHHGGTMGAAAGERIVRAFHRATDLRIPVLEVTASGGARLQEGMIALLQMARTASAVADHGRAGLMSAAVFRSPTTGGVLASWASLADLRAAAPGATIGFGGPRVVKQVTGDQPPADSHVAESAYAHGLVDALTDDHEQIPWLTSVVGITPGRPLAVPTDRPLRPPVLSRLPSDPYALLRRARHPARPSGLEWAALLTDEWVELRGADPTIRAALARIGGQRIVVVAMDRHACGDGAAKPGPEAFRLAQRAIGLADRLGLALLTLIDTPGADPSPAAEAAGVAGEIARTLLAMAELRGQSVALCVGEGGSGAAMALGHADRLLLLEGAVFTVIGPEAGATILYRDATRAAGLAGALRITADDLCRLQAIDGVVSERPVDVRAAVSDALAEARPGDRLTRPRRATALSMCSVDLAASP